MSAVKRVMFGDRMSYIKLIGFWCDIIVLNVHAQQRIKPIIQRKVSMRN
jgi:hypothetical protein